jgi:hypothetical protein
MGCGGLEIVAFNNDRNLFPARNKVWVMVGFTMPHSAARSGRVRLRPRRRLSRLLPRIIGAAAVAWVLFFVYLIYRENVVDDQRAVANCIEEHNRTAVGADGREAAAIAALCARVRTDQ